MYTTQPQAQSPWCIAIQWAKNNLARMGGVTDQAVLPIVTWCIKTSNIKGVYRVIEKGSATCCHLNVFDGGVFLFPNCMGVTGLTGLEIVLTIVISSNIGPIFGSVTYILVHQSASHVFSKSHWFQYSVNYTKMLQFLPHNNVHYAICMHHQQIMFYNWGHSHLSQYRVSLWFSTGSPMWLFFVGVVLSCQRDDVIPVMKPVICVKSSKG